MTAKLKYLAVVSACILFLSHDAPGGGRPYFDSALKTAEWLRSVAIRTPHGTVWEADPTDTGTVSVNLYGGSSGIILFFLEAYYTTGDTAYLNMAASGADYLLYAVSDTTAHMGAGLYEGLAGLGFALGETYKAADAKRYLDGLRHCADLICSRASPSGSGAAWLEHVGDTVYFTTDIIAGSSGTGLFLLYASHMLHEGRYRDMALKAGRRLLNAGHAAPNGTKWAMDALEGDSSPLFKRLMPNFSHGTAGIAYFLARLYEETKQKEFLLAAESGARYLESVARTDSGAACVFHDEPDNPGLYYLGWCHGPPGTARLFYQLWKVTRDTAWNTWVGRFARAELSSGIPGKRSPGFWNNVSQCCGSAGIAEFFLDIYRATGKKEYIGFSKALTSDILSRATADGIGMRWVQAEHRVMPDLLVAQTGYMQGAAGIGMWLLHLDAYMQGRRQRIVFPDSPF